MTVRMRRNLQEKAGLRLKVKQEFLWQKASIHEKYSSRPKVIENICLAQFAIMYDNCTKHRFNKFEGAAAEQSATYTIVSWLDELQVPLPKYIKLADTSLGYMKLRGHPAVLRFHKFSSDTNPHEYLFSELLLYHHWRHEEELHEDNQEACLQLYNIHRDYIIQVKEQLFPNRNNVEEARAAVEAVGDTRPVHIGDDIDAEYEQNMDDQGLEGMVEDEEQAARHPGELVNMPEDGQVNVETAIYQRIDISNMDKMLEAARELDKDQQQVFNTVINYSKGLRRSLANKTHAPAPPLLIVHGGAGSGKSTLINTITLWSEHILRTRDDRHPDHPYIIKTAPTGMAANNINGLTMHSAFHMNFCNAFISLSDKQTHTKNPII